MSGTPTKKLTHELVKKILKTHIKSNSKVYQYTFLKYNKVKLKNHQKLRNVSFASSNKLTSKQ